jgi:hypothetical protein
MRGIDEEGEAANFVETEQIISYNGNIAAHVQTRGSIPLYWNQYPHIKYKPIPYLYKTLDHDEGLQRHLTSQRMFYGSQLMVNLIDQKGVEKENNDRLEAAIHKASYPEDQVRLISFDFHKQCSKMRWDRLELLMNQIKPVLLNMQYFSRNRVS